MSWKETLSSTISQAGKYLESHELKEKMIKLKNKTVDKVKGIDNPEHYKAPAGFTLFQIPVAISTPEITKTLEKLEPFSLKEQHKITDAYIRLLSLLGKEEIIKNAVIASMKKIYLIVWTSKDRLIIVHKEHYQIFTRDMMHTFKIENSGPMGMTFSINEYRFTGSEKSKIYYFIRSYCHELTKNPVFIPYQPIEKHFSYYESYKYTKLVKENQAKEENKQLSVLLDQLEFPLLSIFGTSFSEHYILVLTTNQKLYLMKEFEYTVLDLTHIRNIGLVNHGIFNQEFYMDNYYFTGAGPEHNIEKLIQYWQNIEEFEKAKQQFLETNQILVTFPFDGAISFETPSKEGIVFDQNGNYFLICHGIVGMEMYSKQEFDHYEFVKEVELSKQEFWTNTQKETEDVSLVEAIDDYENIRVRIFVKQNCVLELPLMVMKKVVYQNSFPTTEPGKMVSKELLEHLNRLGGKS